LPVDKATIMIGGGADPQSQRTLKRMVQRLGFQVVEAAETGNLIRALPSTKPHLIMIIANRDDAGDGLEVGRQIRRSYQRIPIILITPNSSEELALGVLRSGINDLLKHPVSPAELAASISRSLPWFGPSSRPAAKLEPLDEAPIGDHNFVGRSPAILAVKQLSLKVASADCTVLITGETGTGKELVADLIHQSSSRSQYPFVVVNCAAIPDTLLESEVFGYEKGAFTGAHRNREGAMHTANLGTLFFDEIGEMSPYAQAKILRTIENKEVCPVGGRKSVPINVRFIAATNRDLEEAMREKKFRSDLYFRLNVARIHLTPLRERKEDIGLLLEYFRKKLNRHLGKEIEGYTQDAAAALLEYDWPGNVRELKNLLEAAFISASHRIKFDDFPELFRRGLQKNKGLTRDERAQLLAALSSNKWNKSKAAQQLQWSRMTLYRKMAKYQISPHREGNTLPSFASL
jgi:DNA-binding NtrC family response regulator